MSDEITQAEKVIDAGFRSQLNAIRKRTLFFPLFVTAAFGGSAIMRIWMAVADRTWDSASGIVDAIFAVLVCWLLWDEGARRQVIKMKYEAAAGMLHHVATEHGWTWEDGKEPSSVSLKSPYTGDEEEDIETVK